MDALKATPSIQAMYQVHENVRDDKQNNAAPEYIANQGDLGEACQANPVLCKVAPDGKTYTISIPARNHSKTYETQKK